MHRIEERQRRDGDRSKTEAPRAAGCPRCGRALLRRCAVPPGERGGCGRPRSPGGDRAAVPSSGIDTEALAALVTGDIPAVGLLARASLRSVAVAGSSSAAGSVRPWQATTTKFCLPNPAACVPVPGPCRGGRLTEDGDTQNMHPAPISADTAWSVPSVTTPGTAPWTDRPSPRAPRGCGSRSSGRCWHHRRRGAGCRRRSGPCRSRTGPRRMAARGASPQRPSSVGTTRHRGPVPIPWPPCGRRRSDAGHRRGVSDALLTAVREQYATWP